MSKCKKFLCFAFPVAVVMALVLGLAFMNIGAGKELANAASSIYVESGGTCTISGGTISDDIDVAGGTLTLTGGTIKGNINLNGTMNLSSGATINGTVNLQNTNSLITLNSRLTQTITVKPSSPVAGTRIAYASNTSYLDLSKISVVGLSSDVRVVVEGHYIIIRPNTFTVTIRAGSGGKVNSTDVVTITNVQPGSAITVRNNTLTINGTTVTATENSGYSFSGWSYSGTTVTSDMTITATFLEMNCTVYFDAGVGGTVSMSAIFDVPNGTPIYESGNTITINGTTVTAKSENRYGFSRWSYYGTTVTSSMTITAEFEYIGGGSVSGDEEPISVDKDIIYNVRQRNELIVAYDPSYPLAFNQALAAYAVYLIAFEDYTYYDFESTDIAEDMVDKYGSWYNPLEYLSRFATVREYPFSSSQDIQDKFDNEEFDIYLATDGPFADYWLGDDIQEWTKYDSFCNSNMGNVAASSDQFGVFEGNDIIIFSLCDWPYGEDYDFSYTTFGSACCLNEYFDDIGAKCSSTYNSYSVRRMYADVFVEVFRNMMFEGNSLIAIDLLTMQQFEGVLTSSFFQEMKEMGFGVLNLGYIIESRLANIAGYVPYYNSIVITNYLCEIDSDGYLLENVFAYIFEYYQGYQAVGYEGILDLLRGIGLECNY